jgi:hypothetical protein
VLTVACTALATSIGAVAVPLTPAQTELLQLDTPLDIEFKCNIDTSSGDIRIAVAEKVLVVKSRPVT